MATVYLIIYLMCVLTALGMGAVSAVSDVRTMKIPNICPVLVIVAFFGAYAACAMADVSAMENWRSHLIAGAIMLVVTAIMYATRTLGAGDSKLAAAYGLWAGLLGLCDFIFFMALTGGILGLAAMFMKGRTIMPGVREGSWLAVLAGGKGALPYGVAIFAGAVVAFYKLDFLSPETLRLFLASQS